ncbi:hypothetical protein NDU88_001988 [Pleurodeles waltl]|uniref:Uncharacterized protein n=1 Tax=Pleurodeles waltl TaxID=8319 RepID=A0AAV7KXN7_PLEWA|nr:hypothetical protein NDU88_001988 [Pleurodeles waltl]
MEVCRAWIRSLMVCAEAEGVALRSEDSLGLRKILLASSWDAMVLELREQEQGPDTDAANVDTVLMAEG